MADEYTPGRLEAFLMRMGTIGELMALMVRGGRWWMLPLVFVLVTIGMALIFLQTVEYFAPFIYIAI